MAKKEELTLQEQYDDLDNIVTTLDILIDELKSEDFKQDLRVILWDAQDKLKVIEEEKEEQDEREYKIEMEEREREYRSIQGF